MTARSWSQQPTRFNLYEDLSGRQYVLLQETGLAGMWLALRLNGRTALTMVSRSNLNHLVLIGRATFDDFSQAQEQRGATPRPATTV